MLENSLNSLNLNGFGESVKAFDKTVFDVDRIDEIRQFISSKFSKIKSFNTRNSSYGLKHIVERAIGNYVSNGELIYAMHLEGYSIKRTGINCYFNLSVKSLKNL